jgi:hypothetical protein
MRFSIPALASIILAVQASPLYVQESHSILSIHNPLTFVLRAAPVPEVISGLSVTTDLAKRDDAGAGIVLFDGICQGSAPNFGAVVSGTEVKTGCIQLDKIRKSFVVSGNYWGWKVYSDPYCLNLATTTNWAYCAEINGGGWSISYGA